MSKFWRLVNKKNQLSKIVIQKNAILSFMFDNFLVDNFLNFLQFEYRAFTGETRVQIPMNFFRIIHLSFQKTRFEIIFVIGTNALVVQTLNFHIEGVSSNLHDFFFFFLSNPPFT